MRDPFVETFKPLHPSLSQHYKLPPDVYHSYADDFLKDPRYANWSSAFKKWQLHCFGGPGCGKTTFAAIVVGDLQRRYKESHVSVISIFLRSAVTHDHAALLEDFLACIYIQICHYEDQEVAFAEQLPYEYEEKRLNGHGYLDRIRTLRSALHDRLKTNEHNFLILDGFDTLDIAAQLILDRELEDLRLRNMSILITRRLASYRPEEMSNICDNCDREELDLYWECPECPRDGSQFCCCYDCHESGAVCDKESGHSASLVEPYLSVDLDISEPYLRVNEDLEMESSNALYNFIVHQLEIGGYIGEKADGLTGLYRTGLQADASTSCMIKNSLDYERGPISHNPPANNEMDHDLARSISEKSHKNINLAKLRIDELEHSEQVEDVEVVRDRIPRSIIAFFDSEIGRILHLHPELSDLALMSICAVAESERAEGMSSEELEQRTRSERAKSLHLSQNPIRSLEDILRATNGLLVSKVYDEDEEILINCYSEMFAWYARDDYNIHLYRAKSKLDTVEPAADVYDCPDEEDEGIEVDDRTERAPSPIITPESLQNTDNSIPVLFRADSGYQSTGPSRQASTSSDIMTLKTIKDTELEDSEPEGAFQAPDNMPETDVCSTVRTGVDEAEFVESTLKSICSFCEEHIFQSSVAYSHHFSSLSDFETAWTPSCIFCSALYANIHPRQEESPATEENSMTWPLYSWTVRSTGRTHNKNPVLTVAFQPAGKGHSSAAPVNIKRFHVQAENEAQVESIPDENTVGKSTYPDDSGKQLKSWINTCDNSHPHCYKYREGSFVPTRLVDIQCEDQEMVRVVETGPNDIRTAYCTLSHTWGPPNFLQLTQSTKGRLMGPGVRLDELTKNFQEAICVARYIGVRYFWIDSLCIMQGKGGDFAHEGQLMHKVYRYSYCNIAIADSADSKGGLFRTREPDEILPGRYESNGMGKLDVGSWRILNADLWKEELLGTKIYTRGWVFQERMLSPRILHFAKKQVFWDCSTLSACEALPEGLPHTLDTISSTDRHWRGRIQITSSTETDEKAPLVGPNDDSLETFWKAALLNYTSCDLTSQGDKTVAIWSIAKIVRDVLGEEYGGGMWRSALHEQLAWRMKNSGIPNTRIPELQIKNPSWSWASVKGPVVVRGRLCPPRCYTVTDHKGQPDLSFEVEDYGDDRDKEPALIDKPLAMAGFMGEGGIVQGQKAGNYTLESSGGDNDQEEAAPQNVPSGTFEVFLDESLADGYSGLINRCRFIILAATATNADGIYLRYPTTEGTGTEEEVSATYSGTALLLISHKEYAFSQKAKYRSLLKDVCKRRPDVLIPDPPYGQGKSLVDQAIELGKLVQKLRKQEKTDIGGIGFRHRYRRIGTVQFRGLSRKRWESIMEKGKTKILLD